MLRAGTIAADVRQRALDALERNATVQAQLVDDLLDVSRIMSGKLRIDSAPVDLVTVITGAIDAVRPNAAAKQLAISVRVDSDARVIRSMPAKRRSRQATTAT
jgi:signal transduction histidine kinase